MDEYGDSEVVDDVGDEGDDTGSDDGGGTIIKLSEEDIQAKRWFLYCVIYSNIYIQSYLKYFQMASQLLKDFLVLNFLNFEH